MLHAAGDTSKGEYYVVWVSAVEARDVAKALNRVDRTWCRGRFEAIDDPDFDGKNTDEDFEYT